MFLSHESLVEYIPGLLQGLAYTGYVSACGSVLAILVGWLLASLRNASLPILRWTSFAYIEVFRDTPILIQLFLFYYVGPSFGVTFEATTVGIVGLGMYGGAYFAEIFRSGFEAIPRGQVEAARLLGLSGFQILWNVKLPQMAVLVLPASTNQVIILVKESAVLSIITVPELTKVTTQIVNETFAIAGPYLAMSILYWGLIGLISRAGAALERKLTGYL
jgi:polar amino acid transport system permease protein